MLFVRFHTMRLHSQRRRRTFNLIKQYDLFLIEALSKPCTHLHPQGQSILFSMNCATYDGLLGSQLRFATYIRADRFSRPVPGIGHQFCILVSRCSTRETAQCGPLLRMHSSAVQLERPLALCELLGTSGSCEWHVDKGTYALSNLVGFVRGAYRSGNE